MGTAIVCWWHRVVLRHDQIPVINGPTEPGVWCYCRGIDLRYDVYARWFPSDGGKGR